MLAENLPGPGLPGQPLGLHDFPALGVTHEGRHDERETRVEKGGMAVPDGLAINGVHGCGEKGMNAAIDPEPTGRVVARIDENAAAVHERIRPHAIGLSRLHARAFHGRTPGPLGMAHDLDHFTALLGDLAERAAQLLGLFPFQGSLIGLHVAQQRHAPGLQVIEQREEALPDVLLATERHGIRAFATRGAKAQKKIRKDQSPLAGQPDGASAIKMNIVGKLNLHRSGEHSEAGVAQSSIGTRGHGSVPAEAIVLRWITFS